MEHQHIQLRIQSHTYKHLTLNYFSHGQPNLQTYLLLKMLGLYCRGGWISSILVLLRILRYNCKGIGWTVWTRIHARIWSIACQGAWGSVSVGVVRALIIELARNDAINNILKEIWILVMLQIDSKFLWMHKFQKVNNILIINIDIDGVFLIWSVVMDDF